MHIVQYHFGQRFLKAFEVKELKHKENTDSVEMFKAKRACDDACVRFLMPVINPACVRFLPNFPTTPARFI